MLRVSLEMLRTAPEGLEFLRKLFADGGVAAIPTDTFYGLAVDPRSTTGVERVFRLKGREAGQGFPVLFAAREQLSGLGIEADPSLVNRYMALWPAPLSVIFRLRAPIAASAGRSNLAVRLPAALPIHFLLEAAGPLTATSANRTGEPPLDDPDEVEAVFGAGIDVLVDGGRTPGGKPSTLVDATTNPPLLLRDGAYPWTGGPPLNGG